MLYRTVPKTGDRLSILGFGCMRFPSKKRGIDEERTIQQIRHAIDSGVNYFDTAPAYHFGKSEQILGRALLDGYREKVRIATKLPHWEIRSTGDMDRILSRQLVTLQTDHIDYYLLHSMGKESWEKLEKLGVLEFLDRAKREGKIKNAGFSFHGTLAAFKEIVDAYDWQFCQIQYNFLDENNQAGTEGLRYAAGKNLAVMVMEPLRGGNLAGPVPEEIQKCWDEAPEKRSAAEWGLRFVWDHPEVTVVLSGMNDETHIDENIRVTVRSLPAQGPAGTYCCRAAGGTSSPWSARGGLIGDVSYAGLCRQCGKCAKACPQHLPIPQLMKDVKADMEGGMRIAVPVLKGGLWCMNKAAKVRAFFSGETSHD
ncbi:MAG: aldo/keto reductase [Methanoregula sp.]